MFSIWKRRRRRQGNRPLRGIESLEHRVVLTAAGWDLPEEVIAGADEVSTWTNHDEPYDVNADGQTSPLDALLVINHLNGDDVGDQLQPRILTGGGGFVDVNGDHYVSPLDALMVIEHLNNPTQKIVNGDATSDFDAVGIVNDGCTGTLISPAHVLTAAHCVENDFGGGFIGDEDGTFEVGSSRYGTIDVVVHPQYSSADWYVGYDIAIMELDRSVTEIEPMSILRVEPQVGEMLTLVGFGEGGTSQSGSARDFGTLRVGQTELEEVTDTHLIWTFDSHDEANTASGDSGGPAFVTVDGELLIAGITSGGDGDSHQLGSESFDTRVDNLAAWIDTVLTGVGVPGEPEPDPEEPTDPEPPADPELPEDPEEPIDDFENPEADGDIYVNELGDGATVIDVSEGYGFVDGMINDAGDRDVFQVTIENGGIVYVDLFSWDGELDAFLQVYNEDGEIVSDNNDSFGSTDSSLMLDLDEGSYFIVAAAHNDATTGEYGLDVYGDVSFAGDFDDDIDDELPEDELPEDELPEDELPEDELPEDELPEDEFPDDDWPEDEIDDGGIGDELPGDDEDIFDGGMDGEDDFWDDWFGGEMIEDDWSWLAEEDCPVDGAAADDLFGDHDWMNEEFTLI